MKDGTLSRGRGTRGRVFVWANVVVLSWLALRVILLALHDAFHVPVWVALHAPLLRAVTSAIVLLATGLVEGGAG